MRSAFILLIGFGGGSLYIGWTLTLFIRLREKLAEFCDFCGDGEGDWRYLRAQITGLYSSGQGFNHELASLMRESGLSFSARIRRSFFL